MYSHLITLLIICLVVIFFILNIVDLFVWINNLHLNHLSDACTPTHCIYLTNITFTMTKACVWWLSLFVCRKKVWNILSQGHSILPTPCPNTWYVADTRSILFYRAYQLLMIADPLFSIKEPLPGFIISHLCSLCSNFLQP